MGDTALIRGIGAAIKQLAPQVKIVGVQAERAPSYYSSWRAGKQCQPTPARRAPDGLATRTPQPENVACFRELVDEVSLVSEEQMMEAIRYLYQREGVLAEPAGAAATAAWLNRQPVPADPSRYR